MIQIWGLFPSTGLPAMKLINQIRFFHFTFKRSAVQLNHLPRLVPSPEWGIQQQPQTANVQWGNWFNWFHLMEKVSRLRRSRVDSSHATKVCSAYWQNVSFTLHVSLTSTHVVLKSHNPELLSGLSIRLSRWATSLSGKLMSGWMGERTDG